MTTDRSSAHPEVGRGGGRVAMWATGALTGGGAATWVAFAALDHPGLGWLALSVAGALVLIVAAALIGPDKDRSRFERIISFAGLVLRRAPGKYVLPPATRTALDPSDSCGNEQLPSPCERQSIS
jgi:hypothetical protein